ncbi:MAG: pyridoxal phosphate-dependent aminotransferase [Eubacteriales bacterium]|nr:pyridoxal phosphate-dependent aminotransferase [Eubacteriales bacterium]
MISNSMKKNIQGGSVIRKMFEEGIRLRKQFGADQVYDFSLGNPDLEPPQEVLEAIRNLTAGEPNGLHAYMSNPGYPEVRALIAEKQALKSGLTVKADSVCMTVGAAGAMNVILKTILDPNDEVIILAPYFVDYLNYVQNHGGKPVIVQSDPDTLLPVIENIVHAITPRTKALIINSPNNPSGVIYSEAILAQIDQALRNSGQTIYVVSDEPYSDLAYDGQTTPSTLKFIEHSIVCTSWSKTMSLPGERIGYLCISPRCEDFDAMVVAVGQCNRMLGFINAPALFQRVVLHSIDAKVNIGRYESRRNRIYDILSAAGFDVQKPAGGLYFFVRCPIKDDFEFVASCVEARILVVPGSGFGFPGFFRLCFAVPDTMIENSVNAFMEIGRRYHLI